MEIHMEGIYIETTSSGIFIDIWTIWYANQFGKQLYKVS